jgi:hypothetical protein
VGTISPGGEEWLCALKSSLLEGYRVRGEA